MPTIQKTSLTLSGSILYWRADSGTTDAWATAMATRRPSEPSISGRSLSRDRSLA
jgi:hypothetical protein